MKEFLDKIMTAGKVAIVGHINPDGDCVGSCLGLYNFISDNYNDKQVDVYLQPIPRKFMFLKGAELIKHQPEDIQYDLCISLDCGDRDRHGDFAVVFAGAKTTACLDHHRSNAGFGDYFYLDADASSTCEVLYRHICQGDISLDTAECLYLGMVHDTGVFKYPATSEETMTIAGKLISKGVRTQFIIDETYYKVGYNQNRLTGEALLNSRLYCGGKVIVTCITNEMFERHHTTKEDTDGIVDKLRVTDGVEVAILAYQKGKSLYKFSFRSIEYVDVSKIAVSYGGGGHIRAAGVDIEGDFEATLKDILKMIEEQL